MTAPHETSGVDSFTIRGCEILRFLNEGGMGKVYLASQPTLNRLVCVKVMSLPEGEDADQSRRTSTGKPSSSRASLTLTSSRSSISARRPTRTCRSW